MKNKLYEWWRNHRRVLTFSGLLILFGLYLSPVVKESIYKNACIQLSKKAAINKFNKDDIEETLLNETGLLIDELASIESYKNCIK